MKSVLSDRFMFATGIENSSPVIQLPDGTKKRIDEFEKTNHFNQLEKDFQLVIDTGISYLRYGIPYYKMHIMKSY